MFLIKFKTGHALPLAGARLLRPRSNRGEHAECPREVSDAWPQTRQIRDHDSAVNRTRTQTVRVREQSVSAFRPRQQSRPRAIHVHAQATASFVREHAAATDAKCPQTVRSRELSTSADWSRTQSVRRRGLTTNYPHRRIAVSILPPIIFPVHVRIIPAHVLI